MSVTEFGIDSADVAQDNLIVGEYTAVSLLIDEAATVAKGQVYQYNAGEDNYDDYTSGGAAINYAVCLETKTISDDTQVMCLVKGKVRLSELDATTRADPDGIAALIARGIIPVGNAVK